MKTIGRNYRLLVAFLLLSIGLWFVFQGGGDSRPNPDEGYRPTDATLEALGLHRQGEFERAFDIYREEARRGDRFAQFSLGAMYDWGHGTEGDVNEAIRWYRKSAKNGDVAAKLNLAKTLLEHEPYRDIDEAIYWLKAGAEKGDARAQNELSKIYFEGTHVDANYEEAVKWARRAVANKNANAMNSMGLAYVDGEGVDVDGERALCYFEMAARHGSREGLVNLAHFPMQSDDVQVSVVEQYRWLWTAQELDERGGIRRTVMQFENQMSWWQVVWAQALGRLWLLRFKSAFE
jgi:uncharacterized protein